MTNTISENPDQEADFLPPHSLYIHIPFCTSKCRYCDFYSISDCSSDSHIIEATLASTISRTASLSRRFRGIDRPETRGMYDTVFIGGGTPSRLDHGQLKMLLSEIQIITSGCAKEWTVEVNPESLDHDKLSMMSDFGVTRISIGVQSLDDRVLAMLGRPVDADTAMRAVRMAARTGLAVSADLMSALPLPEDGLSGRNLSQEVAALADEGLRHISIYDLVVEEGTSIAMDISSGSLKAADEDEAADERLEAETVLTGRGFQRYEISNYAVPGNECLHNEAYWRMDSWLGAGPGAVSSLSVMNTIECGLGGLRISEWPDIERRDTAGLEEWISPRDAAFEMVMMGLRTSRGLDSERFHRRFGFSPEKIANMTFARWKDRFRVTASPFLALDGKGMDLSSMFLSECLLEMERTEGES